ncbi:NFACT family protein [Bacillus tianshenii]|nr:NFACT family protein [Bacillus tianshenii]
MSFDGIVTKAMTEELNEALIGGKIGKIYQPNHYDLILNVRVKGTKQQLILSAHPTYSRVHITNESYTNPDQPPMFCMVMRKHLEGGVIDNIRQIDMDRIIVIDVRSRNEIGDEAPKQLIIEIMGRHSNIILIDPQKENVIESIKHITPAVSRERTVMPGSVYEPPPQQHKLNPFEADEAAFLRKLDFNAGKVDMQIVNSFAGISPLFAKETVQQAGLVNRTSLPKTFFELIDRVRTGKITPQIIYTERKEFFYVLPLTHLQGEAKTFDSISAMLDRFYFGKADRDRIKQQANDLEKFIRNEKKKNEKKIKKLEQTWEDSKKSGHLPAIWRTANCSYLCSEPW